MRRHGPHAAALRYAIGIVGIAKGVSGGDADAAREAVAYARIFHASAKAAALRRFDGLPDLNAPLFNARVKAIFADALVLAGASGRAGGRAGGRVGVCARGQSRSVRPIPPIPCAGAP
jgi:hypothetical protein